MEIRFIKLGEGGKWEKSCIEKDHTIRLGYVSDKPGYHEAALQGDWDFVRDVWLEKRNGNKRAANRDLNQIRDFYELSESDIWVTFYKRDLYWCHAHSDVQEREDGSRIRKVKGSWSNKDKNGATLSIENIDGRITKVQGYQGTICRVSLPEYLLNKINGEVQQEITDIENTLEDLQSKLQGLIKGLWWNDFELLVDLIFSQSGWQRLAVLGKTGKDIDLDMKSAVSNKRAFVQVKSKTTASEFQKYYSIFDKHNQYDEMYFIFHTSQGDAIKPLKPDPRVHVWDVSRVADLVINAGLIQWLIAKRS